MPLPQTRLYGTILAVMGLFGLNSMFGQLYRNGYMAQMQHLLSSSRPLLPGSKTPLLTEYLGLPVLDDLLSLATVLWANVTDGSTPALSLYAFQFSGQLVPIFLVMMIEASRSGHAESPLRYSVLWGYAMQTFGYAIIMPIYAFVHLRTSPTVNLTGSRRADALKLREPSKLTLQALVPAFGLGYFLPALLMSWPLKSAAVHQWLGAVWQGFPLYVVVYQHLFKRLLKPATSPGPQTLSRAYNWAFSVATATQLLTYAIILGAKVVPNLYPTWAAHDFTFSEVFKPDPIHSYDQTTSMATAMHDFFRWDQYVGSAAALFWGIVLEVTAMDRQAYLQDYMGVAWDVLKWSALAGPAGALMQLLQRRDGILLSGQHDGTVKEL